MSDRRDEIQKLDLMREAGIPIAQADRYTLDEKGELVRKTEDGVEPEETGVTDEEANLTDIFYELRELNANVKTAKNWISFMGIMVLLGIIISILGSCGSLL